MQVKASLIRTGCSSTCIHMYIKHTSRRAFRLTKLYAIGIHTNATSTSLRLLTKHLLLRPACFHASSDQAQGANGVVKRKTYVPYLYILSTNIQFGM
jgi:hypothetical protein